ncbi:MAG: Gar1/Naf1 family protein [Candidatus Korarchaeota archaeon]
MLHPKLAKFIALHVAHNNLLIARGTAAPRIGAPVFIEERRSKYSKIGKVADVFGPIDNPYIAIRLDENVSLEGIKIVYVSLKD